MPPQQTFLTHNWRERLHYYAPTDRRHYTRSQPCSHSHCDRSSSLRRHPQTLLPATKAAHTTLQSMDAPITHHAMIPTGIVAPHPTLTISPAVAIHATDQSQSLSSNSHHATQGSQPRNIKNAQDPQPPINATAPRLPPSRILL